MIYVDDLRDNWCHMITDGDIEELHSMAKSIGLKREWFQDTNSPHYDLRPSKRALAVRAGAKQVTTIEMIDILKAKKMRESLR